ncbi:uncharacterized protein LOC116181931 isoform X2 [Photinus pyralis]|uniref:uncharacterized protein LOC116181890 isoform X2 n=1 Tax=Photinus pyralis TaxID=7054 RepID=UPI001267078C|nr:uncharacterized protein LOC116181890 isoform X2 [Photinus pyralis]XP_031358246.1 uncharacterized protein LOC116181931 isoform X2 [Photinus pyralis]
MLFSSLQLLQRTSTLLIATFYKNEVTLLGDSNLRRLATAQLGRRASTYTSVSSNRRRVFVELAIGGQTIGQLRKRVLRSLRQGEEYRYQLGREVIVLIGGNDIRRNAKIRSIRVGMHRLLQDLKRCKIRVNLCTYPTIKLPPLQQDVAVQFNEFLRSVANKNVHIRLIDIAVVVGDQEQYFEEDGIHLNMAGLTLFNSLL